MSNRPKIKKLAQKLTQDEEFRKHISDMRAMLNDRLDNASPGAHFEPNLDKEGEFFIHTPSRRLDLKSISTLGMLMDYLTVFGEQAFIQAIERANKLAPLSDKIQEVLPEDRKMNPEEFAEALESGLIMDLRIFLDKLMALPDPEGAVIGAVTSMMLLDYLKPLEASISSTGDKGHMVLNTPKETYPISSPTILCYVLKYVSVKDIATLEATLIITALITRLSLFPEFQGRGVAVSEN